MLESHLTPPMSVYPRPFTIYGAMSEEENPMYFLWEEDPTIKGPLVTTPEGMKLRILTSTFLHSDPLIDHFERVIVNIASSGHYRSPRAP